MPVARRLAMPSAALLLSVASALAITGPLQSSRPVASRAADGGAPSVGWDELPIAFEANRGQTDPAVRFFARSGDDSVYLTDQGATFALRRGRNGAAIEMGLVGASEISPRATDPLPGVVNYLKGSDPTDWKTAVPTFGKISYPEVYPGIQLVFRGLPGSIEYDFIVEPGVDPDQIALRFDGAESLRLNPDGDLVVGSAAADLVQRAPELYQVIAGSRRPVEGGFRLERGAVRFDVGSYDPSRPLVIDPLTELDYSTFLGGSGSDSGRGIAVDGEGAAYVTGDTLDAATDFPTTPGAFKTTHNGDVDAFVAKLEPSGAALAYSTFLGGSGSDVAHGIAVDGAGAAYVTGDTLDAGTDYPTTPGAFDPSHNGDHDAFVTKLEPSGAALTYSTFLGATNGYDAGFGIALDGAGAAYVTGRVARFCDLSGNCGGRSVLVVKVEPSGSNLAYSRYLGSGQEAGFGIAVDGAGAAYVTGETFDAATDFPTTPGAFDESHNGDFDAFLTKFEPSGAAFAYSTFLGGDAYDVGFGIAVDGAGAAYVTGRTTDGAMDFPTAPGAFDTSHNGDQDAFVTKVEPSGAALAYSTFLGGGNFDYGRGIAVDGAGAASATGVTGGTGNTATDLPTTSGAFDATHNGGGDAFVTTLEPSGAALQASTFVGGAGDDEGYGIALGGTGDVYVTGKTGDAATDYPTTLGAFDTAHNGDLDAFVTKFAGAPVQIQGTCKGRAATITGTDANETFVGTPGADVISGGGGNDIVKSLGGKDLVCGGDGKDKLSGGGGKDRLQGEAGKDKLKGGGGRDKMNGGPGKDTCAGGGGKDKAPKCEKERGIP